MWLNDMTPYEHCTSVDDDHVIPYRALLSSHVQHANVAQSESCILLLAGSNETTVQKTVCARYDLRQGLA